jgi:hypothetical protein
MSDRPSLTEKSTQELQRQLDEDLSTLSSWLGARLNSRNFSVVTASQSLEWR